MRALHVAIDLTALEEAADTLGQERMPVRFVQALVRHAPEARFAVLVRPAVYASLVHLEGPNVRRLVVAGPRRSSTRLARLATRVQRRLQRTRHWHWRWRWPWHLSVLARLGADVVFCPFVNSGIDDASVPLVAAVADLQHISHPYLLSSAERRARAEAFYTTYRRAQTLVCSSSLVGAIARQGDTTPFRRVVTLPPARLLVPPGPPEVAHAATLRRHGLTRGDYLLVVADVEPRNNYRLLLSAFAMFRARQPDSPLRLVCVGGPKPQAASFETIATSMGLGPFVVFLGPLPRDEITTLTEGCRALVVASVYESIGEAALEAMQLGRPVLCAGIDGVAQLTDGAALLFDPRRPAELADALGRVERDRGWLDARAQRGPERAATLGSPAALAQAYLDVLREAHVACLASR